MSAPGRSRVRLAALVALAACCAPAADASDWMTTIVGERAAWDAAYDAAAQSRFIPLQLVLPGVWDGARRIELPAKIDFLDRDSDHWTGSAPESEVLTRTRSNRREPFVLQRFAVRAEQDGLGRVYDSRFGEIRCAGEIKFPLGLWRQGETRRNEYECVGGDGRASRRFNLITIEKIDFDCFGVAHCLQFTWIHHAEGRSKPLDSRRYTFAPGMGEVGHERLQ